MVEGAFGEGEWRVMMQSAIRATAAGEEEEWSCAKRREEERRGMNMKGKLRSESLPSAIYDAIVIHAANCGRLGVGRNENVSRKTHSSPPLSISLAF